MQIKLNNGAIIGSNGKPLTNKELAQLVSSHRVATKAEREVETLKLKQVRLSNARKTLAKQKRLAAAAHKRTNATAQRIKKLEAQIAELKNAQ